MNRAMHLLSADLGCSPYSLQEMRIDAVVRHLVVRGARSVIDLGCGDGDLVMRLRDEAAVQTVIGLDLSMDALLRARARLGFKNFDSGFDSTPRIALMHGSFTAKTECLKGFDAATLVETIEHVNTDELPALEEAVFGFLRPRHVIVTTPNREFNVIYGLHPEEFRHPDHRFEWSRSNFRRWSNRVAQQHRYEVTLLDVGEPHALLGPPTQMAVFSRLSKERSL
jgi:3' terminal RNA ribose 2'-O-methyltransferase Hen1